MRNEDCVLEGLVTVKLKSLSPVRLFATPWTLAYQAPPSKGFSRQEYWSGLPFPSLGSTANFSFLLYRKRRVGQSSAKVSSCFKAPRF